uniref:Uncharacterized protein n=1 Tax=Salix viminalis TaxID=40686 RepID=A0A6N2L9L1_SALVM
MKWLPINDQASSQLVLGCTTDHRKLVPNHSRIYFLIGIQTNFVHFLLKRPLGVAPILVADSHYKERPSFDSRYGSRLLKQQNEECDNSFSDNECEDENNRDEASIISSDLFHGFGNWSKEGKVTDEIASENEVKGEMQAKKAHKSAKYCIKNILTKFHSALGNHTPSAGDEASNSVSTKKKINKLPKMFHRKVHPQNPLAEKEFMMFRTDKTMNTLNEGGYNADLMHQVKDK